MATKHDVVLRAFQDERYRELLFSDPDKALADYKLPRADEQALRRLNRAKFDAASKRLDKDLYSRLKRGDLRNPSVSEKASVFDAIDL